MTNFVKTLFILFLIYLFTACNKKESGICYCSYYGGNKTQYDLKHLSKQARVDTCNMLSNNASAFAGSCKLKK